MLNAKLSHAFGYSDPRIVQIWGTTQHLPEEPAKFVYRDEEGLFYNEQNEEGTLTELAVFPLPQLVMELIYMLDGAEVYDSNLQRIFVTQ